MGPPPVRKRFFSRTAQGAMLHWVQALATFALLKFVAAWNDYGGPVPLGAAHVRPRHHHDGIEGVTAGELLNRKRIASAIR